MRGDAVHGFFGADAVIVVPIAVCISAYLQPQPQLIAYHGDKLTVGRLAAVILNGIAEI